MLSAEDEILKQKYRKAYKETRSSSIVKNRISAMELDRKLCTGKISVDGYLEEIRTKLEGCYRLIKVKGKK